MTPEHIKKSLKQFNPTSHKINLYDPNLKDTSTRFFKIKDEYGTKFKLFIFSGRVKIETAVKTSLLFAVNLPDNICLAKEILKNDTGKKVYTDHSKDNNILNCLNLIKHEIQQFDLESNEGLFIYRNVIQLIVNKTRPLTPEIFTLKRIKLIIEDKFPDAAETIDTSKIPTELQHLIPILFEWAISDDFERDEKIKQSSKAKLKRVVDKVNPKMELINNYLNSFESEPLSYEAALIGNLAELVAELTLKV